MQHRISISTQLAQNFLVQTHDNFTVELDIDNLIMENKFSVRVLRVTS